MGGQGKLLAILKHCDRVHAFVFLPVPKAFGLKVALIDRYRAMACKRLLASQLRRSLIRTKTDRILRIFNPELEQRCKVLRERLLYPSNVALRARIGSRMKITVIARVQLTKRRNIANDDNRRSVRCSRTGTIARSLFQRASPKRQATNAAERKHPEHPRHEPRERGDESLRGPKGIEVEERDDVG